MKTSLITDSFTITVTDITIDFDDDANFEIDFETTLTPAYLRTTPHFIDAAAYGAIDDTYGDIDDFGDNDPYLTYELNVASRHDNGLYLIHKYDRNGDSIDDFESAIFAFGQPIIDFIDGICGLLKIPFYPNR